MHFPAQVAGHSPELLAGSRAADDPSESGTAVGGWDRGQSRALSRGAAPSLTLPGECVREGVAPGRAPGPKECGRSGSWAGPWDEASMTGSVGGSSVWGGAEVCFFSTRSLTQRHPHPPGHVQCFWDFAPQSLPIGCTCRHFHTSATLPHCFLHPGLLSGSGSILAASCLRDCAHAVSFLSPFPRSV